MATLADLAVGNAVPGGLSPITGIDPEFANRILKMYSEMPPEIQRRFNVLSGYRSAERQMQVNPSVKNSRHTARYAVDTTTDPDVVDWIRNTNGRYGVDYPLSHMPGESNHLEMVDPSTRMRMPIPGSPPSPQMAYASTGDSQFKSGLPSNTVAATPPAPVAAPAAEAKADNAQLLSALALQGQMGGGGLSSMLGNFSNVAVPQQAPLVPTQQQLAGGPLPLSRRLS